MTKKVALIEPKSPSIHVYKIFPMPRLGNLINGGIFSDHGYEVRVFFEEASKLDMDYIRKADIVGISSITATMMRGYDIGNEVKRHNPNAEIWYGGPHPTALPEEPFKVGNANLVALGEAEESLEKILSGVNLEDIKGIAFRRGDEIIINRRPKGDFPDVKKTPLPRYDLLAGYDKLPVISQENSRGCPFNCNFCSVTTTFGHKFRTVDNMMSSKKLIMHAKKVQVNGGTKYKIPKPVFMIDDIFNANEDRAISLIQDWMDVGIVFNGWSAQVTTQGNENSSIAYQHRLLEKMKESGCSMLYVGFESVDENSLKAMRKKQSKSRIVETIESIHSHGISVHGMFVIGTDFDDKYTAHRTVEFAKEHGIETIQLMILTPLPGTETYYDMKKQGRLLTEDWTFYDAHHCVFVPKNMSPHELERSVIDAMKEFYSAYQIAQPIIGSIPDYMKLGLNRITGKNDEELKRKIVRNYWLSAYRLFGGYVTRKFDKNDIFTSYLEQMHTLEELHREKVKLLTGSLNDIKFNINEYIDELRYEWRRDIDSAILKLKHIPDEIREKAKSCYYGRIDNVFSEMQSA